MIPLILYEVESLASENKHLNNIRLWTWEEQ